MELDDNNQPYAREIGLFYDGLSQGMHLELKYIDDDQGRTLTVYYKGHMVFCEQNDELECYVPMQEWESKIDYLFSIAQKRENLKYKEVVEQSAQEATREKFSFLQHLRNRWGF